MMSPDVASAAQRLETGLAWAPPWLFSLLILALPVVAAVVVHALAAAAVRRAMRPRDEFWRQLVARTRTPTRFAAVLLALGAAAPFANLGEAQFDLLRHALLIGFIALAGWVALTALDIAAVLYAQRFSIDVSDNLTARKHLTQVRILRRALATLIVVMTIGLALMTIGGVRQWGVSLLAAGGAASLIVGLALQPLLSNLIAGIQIAMTQPIRIDDAVIVQNEFGRVEEINATYVVVRLWDHRRMVLPLTHFIQHPFENWTRESSALIGTAIFYVDYATPVDAMRAKLAEIVESSPLWDREVAALQVTDLRERTMEIRCLVGGRDAGETFDLRCYVREKMIAFLQAEHPHALPRQRVELQDAGEEGARPREA